MRARLVSYDMHAKLEDRREADRDRSRRRQQAKPPLYKTHGSMMSRCFNPRSKDFRHYGGRGITVCPGWRSAPAFAAWIEANLGPRPAGMTLDRIDNDGNYEPGNVRWATWSQQNLNRRPMPRGAPAGGAPGYGCICSGGLIWIGSLKRLVPCPVCRGARNGGAE